MICWDMMFLWLVPTTLLGLSVFPSLDLLCASPFIIKLPQANEKGWRKRMTSGNQNSTATTKKKPRATVLFKRQSKSYPGNLVTATSQCSLVPYNSSFILKYPSAEKYTTLCLLTVPFYTGCPFLTEFQNIFGVKLCVCSPYALQFQAL